MSEMNDLSLSAIVNTQRIEHEAELAVKDALICELVEALKWMVDNDETNEGDEPLEDLGGRSWNEINAYWVDGLNRARDAIAKAEGL